MSGPVGSGPASRRLDGAGETGGDVDDVVVVGAGVVGLACALSLRERGFAVRLIDRDAHVGGASHGNAGIVSPWSFVPQSLPGLWRQVPGWLLDPDGPLRVRPASLPAMLPWARRFLVEGTESRVRANSAAMRTLVDGTVQSYRRWLADVEGGPDTLRDSWYLHVFRGRARPDLSELPWTLRREAGGETELVEGGALREIEPELAPDCRAAIIVKGQARAASPGALCRALAERARREGVTLVRDEVRALVPREGRGIDVVGASGTRPARRVVLCAGGHSMRLLAPLGRRWPLASERGYHLEFPTPGVELRHSVMDVDAKFVASSMPGALRVAGTAEFAPLDAPPNYRRAHGFTARLRRLLPGLDPTGASQWMGVRPSFPDSLPAIGELEGLPGLFAAFGHSHYGMSMAPATGRLVAALVSGERPNVDMAPYRPERFDR